MEVLISFVVPFIILLTVVVFVHEYGHYYYAKKYGVGVTDFSIGLEEKFLVIKINQAPDGNFAQYLLAVTSNFLVIEMFLVRQNKKNY